MRRLMPRADPGAAAAWLGRHGWGVSTAPPGNDCPMARLSGANAGAPSAPPTGCRSLVDSFLLFRMNPNAREPRLAHGLENERVERPPLEAPVRPRRVALPDLLGKAGGDGRPAR